MHIDITEKNLRFRLVAQSGIGVLLSVRMSRQKRRMLPLSGSNCRGSKPVNLHGVSGI